MTHTPTPEAPVRHHVQFGGDFSMMIYKAVCSCGWETVQRDHRWAKHRADEHVASATRRPFSSVR